MKKIAMILAGALLLGAFGLSGCAGSQGGSAGQETPAEDSGLGPQRDLKASDSQELALKSFVLKSFDGKPYEGTVAVTMLFNKDMRIAGNFCNRFVGQAEYNGGILQVEQMATTRMMCVDSNLNRLENLVPQMLMNGAEVNFDGRTMILRQGGHEAEYTLSK